MSKISIITTEQIDKLKKKSALYLPDRPSERGMSPEQIKQALSGFVVDSNDSIVKIINEKIVDINEIASIHVGNTPPQDLTTVWIDTGDVVLDPIQEPEVEPTWSLFEEYPAITLGNYWSINTDVPYRLILVNGQTLQQEIVYSDVNDEIKYLHVISVQDGLYEVAYFEITRTTSTQITVTAYVPDGEIFNEYFNALRLEVLI